MTTIRVSGVIIKDKKKTSTLNSKLILNYQLNLGFVNERNSYGSGDFIYV